MKIDDSGPFLPHFFEHAPAAMALKGLDGVYLRANNAFAHYLDALGESIVGRRDEDLMCVDRARQIETQDQIVRSCRDEVAINESVSCGGTTTSYLTTRFPVRDTRGELVGIGVIAMAITHEQGRIAEAEQALRAAQQANSQLRNVIFTLEELASTDRLTSTWNRRRFEETIDGETHRSTRYGHPLSMLLLDVDHFKRINDTHGHSTGDRVLVEISDRMRATMRKSDSLTRWGGEEFILLMPNTALGHAHTMAERIRETVAEREFNGIGPLTVSIGVAEYLPCEQREEWLERADRAMYRAKHEGRNRVVVDPLRGLNPHRVEHLEGGFVQLVWKDSFRSGHPLIDQQHEGLFTQANLLLEAVLSDRPREEILAAITRLVLEVSQHFLDEEQALAELDFSNLDAHSVEHARLLGRCHALIHDFETGNLPLGVLFQFLAHELVTRHILGADREYFPAIQKLSPRELG